MTLGTRRDQISDLVNIIDKATYRVAGYKFLTTGLVTAIAKDIVDSELWAAKNNVLHFRLAAKIHGDIRQRGIDKIDELIEESDLDYCCIEALKEVRDVLVAIDDGII